MQVGVCSGIRSLVLGHQSTFTMVRMIAGLQLTQNSKKVVDVCSNVVTFAANGCRSEYCIVFSFSFHWSIGRSYNDQQNRDPIYSLCSWTYRFPLEAKLLQIGKGVRCAKAMHTSEPIPFRTAHQATPSKASMPSLGAHETH